MVEQVLSLDLHRAILMRAGIDCLADLKGLVAIPKIWAAFDQSQAPACEMRHFRLIAQHSATGTGRAGSRSERMYVATPCTQRHP